MQPDDLTVAVIELCAAIVVRCGLMRLEVSVGDSAGVVGVGFVQMLWRKSS